MRTALPSFLFFSIYFLLFSIVLNLESKAQSYSYYLIGDSTDISPGVEYGTCLMGGGIEQDQAMSWFLSLANGGNIVVIRASGSDGYNEYLYNELGQSPQSVESIVFHNAEASYDSFVLDRIAKAEAIWIAGGNQWNYVDYWKESPVGDLLRFHVQEKQAPIGGTSAGMAIMGHSYFSAENGTISSFTALQNPYHNNLTLGHNDFLNLPYLANTITDTHYDDPDRRGRHLTFMARMTTDLGIASQGIACDEHTALCIDQYGIARAYGEYPAYPEDVYFLMANCETEYLPEQCLMNQSLTWNHEQSAVKVYRIPATGNGEHYIDLGNPEDAYGGTWEHWWAISGELYAGAGSSPDCSTDLFEPDVQRTLVMLDTENARLRTRAVDTEIHLFSAEGKLLKKSQGSMSLPKCRGLLFYKAIDRNGGVESKSIFLP